MLIQGGATGVNVSTYPSEDADMLAAEAQYCAMEAELQQYLDTYESTHDYDEYHFDLDDIEHDPYVLISAVTALMGREWTLSEVGGILDMLFEKQYILTETITTETRYRTETRTGYYTDADGNLQSYEYDVQVPYTYYICTVRLENFNLSHVPVYIMSQDQLSLYAMYMATLGNRPDLFGGSEYIGKYYTADYEKYEIPPEALETRSSPPSSRRRRSISATPTSGAAAVLPPPSTAPALSATSTTTAAWAGASAGWVRRGCASSVQGCPPPMSDRVIWCSSKAPMTPPARPMWASMWATI